MRIFFITSKLNFKTSGGSVEELDLIIKTLQALGNEVTAVTVFSYMNNIAEQPPYRVIEENIKSRGLVGIQRGIFKVLKKYEDQADIFQIDGHIGLYGAGLYRRLGGKTPVSAFFNRELIGWAPDRSIFFQGTKESLPARGKRLVRRYIEKYIGMPLANGLDLKSFINPLYQLEYETSGLKKGAGDFVLGDPTDFKKIMEESRVDEYSYAKRNKTAGPINIFYSSRMAPGKGFDVLLLGFSLVKNKENFHLILGGDGPESHQVRQMVKDLKLEPYVELTGWVDKEKLYELYRQADIFIQADWRFIGTSMSLLYAMAFGVPAILPGGGGLQWQAKNSALYFKYRDTDDLARKIEQLGSDPELRAELSRQCYIRLAEDEMNYQKKIGELYERMKMIVKG